MRQRLVQKNLLLQRVLDKHRGLSIGNKRNFDSDDSSDEEMDIRQENEELAETVSRQREQIEGLFKEVSDLKALRREIKVLKFDKKRLKKRVTKQKKFW